MEEKKQSGQMKCHHCGKSFGSQDELHRHENNCGGQSNPHK